MQSSSNFSNEQLNNNVSLPTNQSDCCSTRGWVRVSHIPPTASIDEIQSLFSFCGTISSIKLARDSESAEGWQCAIIEFWDSSAVSTATLLSKALIQDSPIEVEKYCPTEDERTYFQSKPFLPRPEGLDNVAHQSKVTIIGRLIAAGISLAQDVREKAIAWDRDNLHLKETMNTMGEKLANFGESVKTQAVNLDNKLGISEKTDAVVTAAGHGVAALDNKLGVSEAVNKVTDGVSAAMNQVTDKVNETSSKLSGQAERTVNQIQSSAPVQTFSTKAQELDAKLGITNAMDRGFTKMANVITDIKNETESELRYQNASHYRPDSEQQQLHAQLQDEVRNQYDQLQQDQELRQQQRDLHSQLLPEIQQAGLQTRADQQQQQQSWGDDRSQQRDFRPDQNQQRLHDQLLPEIREARQNEQQQQGGQDWNQQSWDRQQNEQLPMSYADAVKTEPMNNNSKLEQLQQQQPTSRAMPSQQEFAAGGAKGQSSNKYNQ